MFKIHLFGAWVVHRVYECPLGKQRKIKVIKFCLLKDMGSADTIFMIMELLCLSKCPWSDRNTLIQSGC